MNVIGIDISKATFDAYLITEDQTYFGDFNNDKKGFRTFRNWLKKRNTSTGWACMEATGRYGDELAEYLFEANYKVSVVNPARTRRYFESKLIRTTTDRIAAQLIADFCLTQKPDLWQPTSPEVKTLQQLVRRVHALKQTRTQELNRKQGAAIDPLVAKSINKMIKALDKEILSLEKEIKDHVEQHPELKRQRELLVSIPGFADISAFELMSEIGDISRFESADQVIAYAGLSPKSHDSGTSVKRKPRLSKIGNSRLRSALFFPALSALQHNPIIIALKLRLEERNKTRMIIVGAAMRKMLRLAYGVLKTGKTFDPNFVINMQNTA